MKLIVCGDFVTTGRGMEAVKNSTALSSEIIEILKNADFSIVNLEAPVANAKSSPIRKVGPHLHTFPEALKYLKSCGVDVVTLANNHFYDYGQVGVIKTIETCEEFELLHVGGGRTQDEYRSILYIKTSEQVLAILNYCEYEFSVNEYCGANPMDPINVFYDISEAKKNADIIIVITHGGHERYNLPSPRMKHLYRFFVDCGANAVINHHQHCYSGYEEYNNAIICYGLGNFFFEQIGKSETLEWNKGYMLELNFKESSMSSFKLLPYYQCLKNSCQTWLMPREEMNEFEEVIANLNMKIGNDQVLNDAFNNFCMKNSRNLLSWFTPYSNRILLALYRRNLLPSLFTMKKLLRMRNVLTCESHRDIGIKVINYECFGKNKK